MDTIMRNVQHKLERCQRKRLADRSHQQPLYDHRPGRKLRRRAFRQCDADQPNLCRHRNRNFYIAITMRSTELIICSLTYFFFAESNMGWNSMCFAIPCLLSTHFYELLVER